MTDISSQNQLVLAHDNEQPRTPNSDNTQSTQLLPPPPPLPPEYLRPLNQLDNCDLNPEFAVICSFIAQFGDKIDLSLNIEQLKNSIENQNQLDESLIDIHVKLLKKIRRYFVRDQWERALIRYAAEYSYEDAVEIEQLGYLKTRPSIKLELLCRLLDAQFECDPKFKAAINSCEAKDLRHLLAGRDIKGNTYWQQTDPEGNLKIFQEHPLDYKSFKAICSNITELSRLIEDLENSQSANIKGEPILQPYNPLPEIFPDLFKAEEIEPAEDTQVVATNKKSNSRPKKGRCQKSRGKKHGSLATVNEGYEENSTEPKYSILGNEAKINGFSYGQNNELKVKIKLEQEDEIGSIESQVALILDHLLGQVASNSSAFGFGQGESVTDKLSNEMKPDLSNVKQEGDLTTKLSKPKKAPSKSRVKRERTFDESLPRRSSSRIQQLQLKKEEEEEEKRKKMIKEKEEKAAAAVAASTAALEDDSRSRGSRSNSRPSQAEIDDSESQDRATKKRRRMESWRRGKGKKKLSWDQDDSDLSNTSSSTSDEEDPFGEEDMTLKYDANLDDEFACEDEETNMEPVIIKRARTARQSLLGAEDSTLGDPNQTSICEEDKPCGRCDKSNDPEWILLCDKCDDGYHTACCVPPLFIVPDGDWFCPPCEHKMLLAKMKDLHESISKVLEEKERERLKAAKLRQAAAARRAAARANQLQDEILPAKRQRGFLSGLNEPLALQDLEHELDDGDESSESDGNEENDDDDDEEEEEAAGAHDDDFDDDASDVSYGRRKRKKATKSKARKPVPKRRPAERPQHFEVQRKPPRKTYSKRRYSESEAEAEDDLPTRDEETSESEEEEDFSEEDERPRPRRARACVSYKFQEYDELIQSAIGAESDDGDYASTTPARQPERPCYGRGKDMATIEALAYQQENGLAPQTDQSTEPATVANADGGEDHDDADNDKEDNSDEADEIRVSNSGGRDAGRKARPRAPRKKARRLNDLDALSEAEDATSDESFKASSATEVETEEDDMEENLTEEESNYEGTDSSVDEIIASVYSRKKRKATGAGTSRRKGKKSRRRDHYESDDDYKPTRGRRAATRKVVCYRESSDEEDELVNNSAVKRKPKKNTLESDEESEASWKGSPVASENIAKDGDENDDEDEDDEQERKKERGGDGEGRAEDDSETDTGSKEEDKDNRSTPPSGADTTIKQPEVGQKINTVTQAPTEVSNARSQIEPDKITVPVVVAAPPVAMLEIPPKIAGTSGALSSLAAIALPAIIQNESLPAAKPPPKKARRSASKVAPATATDATNSAATPPTPSSITCAIAPKPPPVTPTTPKSKRPTPKRATTVALQQQPQISPRTMIPISAMPPNSVQLPLPPRPPVPLQTRAPGPPSTTASPATGHPPHMPPNAYAPPPPPSPYHNAAAPHGYPMIGNAYPIGPPYAPIAGYPPVAAYPIMSPYPPMAPYPGPSPIGYPMNSSYGANPGPQDPVRHPGPLPPPPGTLTAVPIPGQVYHAAYYRPPTGKPYN